MATDAPGLRSTSSSRASDDRPNADADGYFAAFLDDYAPTAIVETSTANRALVARVLRRRPRRVRAPATRSPASWPTLRVASIDVARRALGGAIAGAASARFASDGWWSTPPWDVEAAAAAVDEHGDESSPEPSNRSSSSSSRRWDSAPAITNRRACACARLQQLDLDGRTVVDLGTGSGRAGDRGGAARLPHAPWRSTTTRRGGGGAAERHAQPAPAIASRCAAPTSASDPALRGDVVLGNLTGALLRRSADAVRGVSRAWRLAGAERLHRRRAARGRARVRAAGRVRGRRARTAGWR